MTTEQEDEAMPKLLPCPFCGGTEFSQFSHWTNRDDGMVEIRKIQCLGCNAENSIGGWNIRPSPAPTPAGEAEKHAVEKILDMVLNRGATESGTYRERAERIVAALRRAQPPQQTGMSEDWCMAMADLEGDAEIGAGAIDHPLRAQPTGDVEGLSKADRDLMEQAKKWGWPANELLAIIDRLNSRLAEAESELHEIAYFAETHYKGAGLKAESKWIIEKFAQLGIDFDEAIDRAEAAEASVAVLEKALEPFAELAGGFDAHIYNDEKLPLLFKDEDHPVDDRGPTIGDLRRARTALSTRTKKEENNG
jgi:hypothetical protein